MMSASRVSTVVAVSLLAFIAASLVLSLAILFDPQPARIERSDGGGDVVFSVDRSTVVFEDECVLVRWAVSGSETVLLNDIQRPPTGELWQCQQEPILHVFFPGQAEASEYRLPRHVLLPNLAFWAIVMGTVAVIAAYVATPSERRGPFFAYVVGIFREGVDLISGPPPAERQARLWVAVALLALYAYCVVQWLTFYNHGNVELAAHDWTLITAYRTVQREAVMTGQLPLFVSEPLYFTDRFLGHHDAPWGPQILLLPWLTHGQFAAVDTLLWFTAGYVGLLLIRRRTNLSLLFFVPMVLLFSFNGFVTAHLAVGHGMWNGYFALAFFILFLLEMLGADRPHRPAVKIALTLAVMAVSGMVHLALWCMLLLVVLGLPNARLRRPALIAAVGGLSLGMFRYLPTIISYRGWRPDYLSGFPTLADLLDGLTAIHDYSYRNFTLNTIPAQLAATVYKLDWWELDFYVGLLGLALIAYFGIYLAIRNAGPREHRYPALDLPLVVLTVLTFGELYGYIATMPLPFVSSERVSARMLIVPLALLIVIGSIRASAVVREWMTTPPRIVLTLGLVWFGAFALRMHTQAWSIVRIDQSGLPPQYEETVSIVQRSLATMDAGDAIYVGSVVVGYLISAATAAICVWIYRGRGRRRTVRVAGEAGR